MTDKLLTMQEVKHFSNALAFVTRSNWITILLQKFATITSDIGTLSESNYSSYYSNYSSIRTLIVANIVLLEINGGSEHRYSSSLSGSLL